MVRPASRPVLASRCGTKVAVLFGGRVPERLNDTSELILTFESSRIGKVPAAPCGILRLSRLGETVQLNLLSPGAAMLSAQPAVNAPPIATNTINHTALRLAMAASGIGFCSPGQLELF